MIVFLFCLAGVIVIIGWMLRTVFFAQEVK